MLCKSPRTTLLGDLSDTQAEAALKAMSPQPTLAAYTDAKVSYCGWREIPTTYVCCENDALVPSAFQHQMAAMIGAEIVSIDAGHVAMLSQPEKVAAIVRRVASE